MLDVFRAIPDTSHLDLASLLAPGWDPAHVNGSSARPWGKSGESSHVPQDPGVCWDTSGAIHPLGLQGLTREEKELFASDVNSPMKLAQQNKEGALAAAGAPNGRKTSISHGSAANYALSSPSSASRPGTRRRETTDTNPFPAGAGLASPTSGGGRFSRDEAASWFGRKNDPKEASFTDEPEDDNSAARDRTSASQGFGSLNRSSTTGASGFPTASNIWGGGGPPAPTTSGIGSFGNFSLGGQAAGDKRFGAGGSRLAHLMPRDSAAENAPPKSNEPPSADIYQSWRLRPRTDTDPFGTNNDQLSGSAVLGGSQEASPPTIPSQAQPPGGIFDTPAKGSAGDFGMSGLALGGNHGEGNDTASPETNPFQSPPADRGGAEEGDSGVDRSHAASIGSERHPSNFSTISRAFANNFDGSDRSQTSSVGGKSHPALSALTSTGWPGGPSSGTPDRERPTFGAFGSSLFSPVGDLQSPGLSNLGGNLGGIFSHPGAPSGMGGSSSLRGSSKLGSLFPPAMQAQMQTQEQENLGDSVADPRQTNPLGAIGRGPATSQSRETESPVRQNRAIFDDLFPSADPARMAFTAAESNQASLAATAAAQGQPFTPTAGAGPFSSSQTPTDPTSLQSRTMVMPDRMRWVYLDPQGQVQGPFTGLEMNDWFKAQFFSADLRVKKIEDPDFEPLGQLIRRIGNSREPFLVPQIGIPHGPPSQAGPFSAGDNRGVVPPLLGAFPSFGRTLTAEEQNNLERRKQEEQFLMARQREFLAHQQAVNKMQMQTPGGASGALHHHSSAHSLQSQPSFGSMASPIGMPPQGPISGLGPTPGFFDAGTNGPPQSSTQPAIGSSSSTFPQELNAQERQILASLTGVGPEGAAFPSQPIGAPSSDPNLRAHLPSADQLQKDAQGFSARLQEFHEIRARREAEEASKSAHRDSVEGGGDAAAGALSAQDVEDKVAEVIQEVTGTSDGREGKKVTSSQLQQQQLSLTQQVQKTQAAAAAASGQVTPEDVWNKHFVPGLPMPFPPPSTTPLPAPTAQRGRSTLPTQFSAPSPSGTPDTYTEPAQPPPLAPWAPQPGSGGQKGPSLKEIQEAEAKKAAKAEEAAAAARRALLDQEAAALREREKASTSAAAPGLPSTSTWGTGSPVNVSGGNSPWTKPATGKGSAPGPVGPSNTTAAQRKTLADIQREEEARKQKSKETVTQVNHQPSSSMGKRYADLAGKTSGPPPGLAHHGPSSPAMGAAAAGAPPQASGNAAAAGSASGWATVGAGGKVKIPTGPAAQSRAPSSGNARPTSTPAPAPKSTPKPAASHAPAKDNTNAAMEEFNKWLHRELSRGLDGIKDSKFIYSIYSHPPPLKFVTSIFLLFSAQPAYMQFPHQSTLLHPTFWASRLTLPFWPTRSTPTARPWMAATLPRSLSGGRSWRTRAS